jgi:hypothetical protein
MPVIKHEKWNAEAGEFYKMATDLGVEVFNLSDPTFCDSVPREKIGYWSYSLGE